MHFPLFLVLGKPELIRAAAFLFSLVAGFCVSVAGRDGLNFKVARLFY